MIFICAFAELIIQCVMRNLAKLTCINMYILSWHRKKVSGSHPNSACSISWSLVRVTKIPKISPGGCIFQRPFLRGLFLEGPIFGGPYVRREICVSKSIGLACGGKAIYHFCFVLLCNRGQIPSTSPLGGLYSEGRFNREFLHYDFGGLIHGGAYFRNFTVFH